MTGLLDIARLFLFVREAGANRGQRVQAIQTWSGGAAGDSWCCEWATMVLDLHFAGESPIPRLQACQDVLDIAHTRGMLVNDPMPGDLVLSVNDAGHAHHIGIVSDTDPLRSIAANTSEDGTSSNGDRVADHEINPAGKLFVRVPGVQA